MRTALAELKAAISTELAEIEAGEVVLVACSGGRDSLALAVAAQQLSERTHWRVGAVVVDHGLQVGSAEVSAAVTQRLVEQGLDPVELERVQPDGRGGPEASARAARYAALDRAAERVGARVVLLGHTRDDQAETVLLGLARGSGLRSLAGMAPRSGPSLRYRRPLLGLTRATTAAACAELGVEVWDDPHNQDPVFARVRVRNRVLPMLEAELGPGVCDALARTAQLAAADAEALDEWADRCWVDAVDSADGSLGIAPLEEVPQAIRARLLRRAAAAAGVPSGELSMQQLLALDALVVSWRGQGAVALPGGVSGERRYGRLGFVGPVASGSGSEPSTGDQWTRAT